MEIRQLKQSQLLEIKRELLTSQLGKCALCGKPLTLNSECHLDHDHQTGQIRAVLCRGCNVLEGRIHGKFIMSGLRSNGVEYIEWLRKLADYLEDDYSENDYHPQHMIDQTKYFSRLRINDQKLLLDKLGIKYPDNAKKSDLAKLYKKSFINNPRCDFDNGKYDVE